MEVKSENVVKVDVKITFEELVEAVSGLSLKDKERLYEILHEQIEQEDTELMLQDPEIVAEIEQARKDYEAGDYMTIEEYKAYLEQHPEDED